MKIKFGDHKAKVHRPQPKSLDKKAHPSYKDKLSNTKGPQTQSVDKHPGVRSGYLKEKLTDTKGVQVPGFTKKTAFKGVSKRKNPNTNKSSTKTIKHTAKVGKTKMQPDFGNAAKIWKPFGI